MPKTVEAIIKNTSSLLSMIKNNSVRVMSWDLTLLIHFKILGNNTYYILILNCKRTCSELCIYLWLSLFRLDYHNFMWVCKLQGMTVDDLKYFSYYLKYN